ncbi:MAG TPA: hypothetical protein VF188_17320 [Longimicrobiales bacterium]
MTRKTAEMFKKVDEALNRFQRGEGMSRVVTRSLGRSHFLIEIVSSKDHGRVHGGQAARNGAGRVAIGTRE